MHKVFYHVIMNAIKYTPDGGKITISGKVVEETSDLPEIEISVRDTGIGIDKKNQEVVFEKFYQTGEVLMVNPDRYVGDFYNPEFDVSGRVHVTVRGSSQTVTFSGRQGHGSMTLRRN